MENKIRRMYLMIPVGENNLPTKSVCINCMSDDSYSELEGIYRVRQIEDWRKSACHDCGHDNEKVAL